MPLRLLRHHEIDLAAWDACVASARQQVPYAYSWWLQATAGRWEALVEVGSTGEYQLVLPLPVRRRLGGLEVYQPPFTQQLGLFTAAPGATGSVDEVLQAGAGDLRYTRFYTQLNDQNPLSVSGSLATGLGPVVLQSTPRLTYQLRLEVAYEVLHLAYAADYRRRLRQLATTAYCVTPASDAGPLLQLFRQTKGGPAGLKSGHYGLLQNLLAALQARGLLEMLEVRHPHTYELMAGALFVTYPGRLIYLFAAASAEGKKAGAPLLLLDHQIRRYASTPGLILDFEGGMIPSIARFFANFGATPVPYAALSFTSHRPWYLSWMR
jgi:hypothetical protein